MSLRENMQKSTDLVTIGTRQMYQADFVGAISTFDKALELNPISLFALQYRAICKHHLSVSEDNMPYAEHANLMKDVISDLENALEAAKNMQKLLMSKS